MPLQEAHRGWWQETDFVIIDFVTAQELRCPSKWEMWRFVENAWKKTVGWFQEALPCMPTASTKWCTSVKITTSWKTQEESLERLTRVRSVNRKRRLKKRRRCIEEGLSFQKHSRGKIRLGCGSFWMFSNDGALFRKNSTRGSAWIAFLFQFAQNQEVYQLQLNISASPFVSRLARIGREIPEKPRVAASGFSSIPTLLTWPQTEIMHDNLLLVQ